MKKKLLLTLMMLIAATAALSAQDEMEQTAPPSFVSDFFNMVFDNYKYDPEYREVYLQWGNTISLINEDEDEATIYYRELGSSEWYEYEYTICPPYSGTYELEAYAQAEGKLPSEITVFSDYVETIRTEILYRVGVVDGINYHFIEDYSDEWQGMFTATEVSVCNNDDPCYYSETPCYSGDIVIPSVIEFRGESYAVTGIEMYAFWNCAALKSLDIPESITSVGQEAFDGCSGLEKVLCRAVVPPMVHYGSFCDASTLDKTILYVPAESLESYRAHEEWGKFTHIAPFIGAGPGDVDGDGSIGITDVTNMIDLILAGNAPAYCDVDGDGVASISDLTVLIDMILSGN